MSAERVWNLGAIPRCTRTVSCSDSCGYSPHNLANCYLLELAFSLFLLGQNSQRGSNTWIGYKIACEKKKIPVKGRKIRVVQWFPGIGCQNCQRLHPRLGCFSESDLRGWCTSPNETYPPGLKPWAHITLGFSMAWLTEFVVVLTRIFC